MRSPVVLLCAALPFVFACGETVTNGGSDAGSDASFDAAAPCASDGWRAHDLPGKFVFRAPCSVTGGPIQGIDSYVGEYADSGMSFLYDYGGFSSPLTEWSGLTGYTKTDTTVDGRAAYLVLAEDPTASNGLPYLIGLHVPQVDSTGTRLTFSGSADSAARRDVLAQIFETVDFQ